MSLKFRLAILSAATLAFVFTIQRGAHPVHADSAANARGAEIFATHGCEHCHGKDGVNGELGPDLQRVRNHMNSLQITKQIREGSKGMPVFGPDQLSDEQVKDLVVYLRTKRKILIAPLPVPPPPPAPKPDPDSGF